MKLLFIARAFPPVIGGIENQNFQLIQSLKKTVEIITIANPKGKWFLPIFYPFAFFCALLKSNQYDVILLGDAVSAPLGWILKKFVRKPVHCIIHGLDISFQNVIYQKLVVQFCLPRLDLIFAVGNATKEIAISKLLNPEKIHFIPNGVRPEGRNTESSITEFRPLISSLKGRHFYLTLGRLVKRKGVAWFVDNVAPKLPENILYVVAGDGPERKNINILCGNHPNVILTGSVSEAEKQWLLKNARIFIQPNIPVAGDVEGFGLVVLEAGAHGTPVVASRLEGLIDAIHHRKNGLLTPSLDYKGFVESIEYIESKLQETHFESAIQAYTLENFHWDKIAGKYLKLML